MFPFVGGRGIAPIALDARAFGAGRLPTGAGPEAGFEVIDRHAVAALAVLTHAVSRRETEIVRPAVPSGCSDTTIWAENGSHFDRALQPSVAGDSQALSIRLACFLGNLQQEGLYLLGTYYLLTT